MTNYLVSLTLAAVLLTGACSAADAPAAPAASKPAAAQAAPASAPGAAASSRYVQAASGSSLTFTFVQEGAVSKGAFKQFSTELVYDEKSLAGSLKVQVQISSIDTQDKDRDGTLTDTDLFNAKQFPTAQYVANSFAKGSSGALEAVGKLTLRGVTRDLRLPLKINRTTTGLELSGETSIKRLDYGIGQGEWKSTESVGDEVKVQYKVSLIKAK